MTGLALVLLSHTWLPLASADDLAHRYEVAAAIEEVTRDEGERRALMVFAAEESHFARDVAECRRKGDNGHAVTAWQIHVYGATRSLVCGSLVAGQESGAHGLQPTLFLAPCPAHAKNYWTDNYTCCNHRACRES